jgi:hypothetical protein
VDQVEKGVVFLDPCFCGVERSDLGVSVCGLEGRRHLVSDISLV